MHSQQASVNSASARVGVKNVCSPITPPPGPNPTTDKRTDPFESFGLHSPAHYMAVDEEQLPRGAWLSSQHDQTYGTVFKTPMIRGYGGSARLMHALRDAASPDLDVYQFGVYTGGTMKSLARRIPTFGHMYGCE